MFFSRGLASLAGLPIFQQTPKGETISCIYSTAPRVTALQGRVRGAPGFFSSAQAIWPTVSRWTPCRINTSSISSNTEARPSGNQECRALASSSPMKRFERSSPTFAPFHASKRKGCEASRFSGQCRQQRGDPPHYAEEQKMIVEREIDSGVQPRQLSGESFPAQHADSHGDGGSSQ